MPALASAERSGGLVVDGVCTVQVTRATARRSRTPAALSAVPVPGKSDSSCGVLLLLLLLLSAVHVGNSRSCSQRIEDSGTAVTAGSDVSIQSKCYPNGTVEYSWSSSYVELLQTEYQCHNLSNEMDVQILHPYSPDYLNEEGVLEIDHWQSDYSYCIFSGCYTSDLDFELYLVEPVQCLAQEIEMPINTSPVVLSPASTIVLTSEPSLLAENVIPTSVSVMAPTSSGKIADTTLIKSTVLYTSLPTPTATVSNSGPTVSKQTIGIAVGVGTLAMILLTVCVFCTVALTYNIVHRRASYKIMAYRSQKVDLEFSPVDPKSSPLSYAHSEATLLESLGASQLEYSGTAHSPARVVGGSIILVEEASAPVSCEYVDIEKTAEVDCEDNSGSFAPACSDNENLSQDESKTCYNGNEFGCGSEFHECKDTDKEGKRRLMPSDDSGLMANSDSSGLTQDSPSQFVGSSHIGPVPMQEVWVGSTNPDCLPDSLERPITDGYVFSGHRVEQCLSDDSGLSTGVECFQIDCD